MGIIRFLLAAAVITAHCRPYFETISLSGGNDSVKIFFMISGFYMALILNEKYANLPIRQFYFNRILRIFPTYYVMLFLYAFGAYVFTVILHLKFNMFCDFREIHKMNFSHLTVWSINHLFIIGMEWWIPYKTWIDGNLISTAQFMLNPPVWSLSHELMFYLIAPFIIKLKPFKIILITLFLFVLKFCFLNIMTDPSYFWQNHFFPFELPLFLLGILSFFCYNFLKKKHIPLFISNIIWGFFIIIIMTYPLHQKYPIVMISSAFFSIPFIFSASKELKWDRKIGNLSFPIYMIHMLILAIMGPILWKISYGFYCYSIAISVLLLSTVGAILNEYLITSKIEKYRIKIQYTGSGN